MWGTGVISLVNISHLSGPTKLLNLLCSTQSPIFGTMLRWEESIASMTHARLPFFHSVLWVTSDIISLLCLCLFCFFFREAHAIKRTYRTVISALFSPVFQLILFLLKQKKTFPMTTECLFLQHVCLENRELLCVSVRVQ